MATMVTLTCSQCGKSFERFPWEVKRRKATFVFCSRVCQKAAMTWHNPKTFQKAKTRQMSNVEAAWLAGLFDGEGTVIFPSESAKGARGEKVRIVIGITNREIVDVCKKITGVGYIQFKKKYQEHWLDQWLWAVYGPNARDLLKQMLPYLIIKREKALKCLSFNQTAQEMLELEKNKVWDKLE